MTVTLTLSAASSDEVTVNWSNGSFSTNTATYDVDYVGDDGVLTFAAGETTKTVTVETTDDLLDEEDTETFSVALAVLANATFSGGVANVRVTVTINDDDPPPSLTVADATTADEGGNATFTVTLSAVSARDVTVDYATADGSATAGSDYTASNGTLPITAGTTMGTVEVVTLADDALTESAETFTLTLTNPSNATLGTKDTGTGTIRNLAVPAAPTGLMPTAGNGHVALAWNEPASDAVIAYHEYRYKTDSDYQDNWKAIPYSAPGGFNEDGFTVTGLDNGTAHTFQLRAANDDGASAAVESSAVTPSGSGHIVESINIRRFDNQDGEPYGIGDRIVFVVNFSDDVPCADPSPKAKFDIGSTRKNASKSGGGTGDRWWFEYNVAEGDFDSDGIEIPAGSTALPDNYYQNATGGCSNRFDKSGIKAQGPFPDRKVDGVYPSVDSAVVNVNLLLLTWDETLRDDSVPDKGDFAVTVAGSARSVTELVFADSTVRLILASAVRAGETVTVSYTKGTNPLKDLASNEAPALTDQAVTNNTVATPPVAVTGISAKAGVLSVTLRWDAPASDADITHHEYRYKTGGSYPATWTEIPDSAPGGANEAGYRVEDLTADTAYTFELRAANDAGGGDAAESEPATPTAALPPNPHSTDFYLWSTTLTVGKASNGDLGYSKSDSYGSLSTGRKFGYPPWNPPHKTSLRPRL